MSSTPAEAEVVLGLEAAGVLMTPEEFDRLEEYDENYRYELVQGVLVVTPIPLPEETGPNELLGHLLLAYQEHHPRGSALDYTLPQQYVRTGTSRRDLPTVAVEFVSAGRRNRQRDYVDKRREYLQAGIAEYWIIDRFQRTLTVIRNQPSGPQEQVVSENQSYQSPLLPEFEVPLARLLAAADRLAGGE